ncbi:MAG: imelysin family protein [Pseudomonadota bacterium]|nr:imelysin family protein [Pseudomonadota bacterium]
MVKFKFIIFVFLFTFKCVAERSVIINYSNIAEQKYNDSWKLAKMLLFDVKNFLKNTTEPNFKKVKTSWLEARKVYQQTEVFRFGNPIVDDWEGRVNAWPLDEGLIDYVNVSNYYPSENDFSNFNVISNKQMKVEGNLIDASIINIDLLKNKLHEIGGNEANVAIGYHAIEFLLWGQDLNGTGKGSGQRPFTDFSLSECTNDNCTRRRQYLLVVSELLVDDLEEMKVAWANEGDARNDLLNSNEKEAIKRILTGMGSLSYGELAGERMKLGLMLHDPEEEHDCFSDNTHNSHYFNVIGIQNIYLGRYKNINNNITKGKSLSDLVAVKDKNLDMKFKKSLNNTVFKMKKIVDSANKGITYDMLIGENNKSGNLLIQDAVDALVAQSKDIEKIAMLLKINNLQVEGSDSLDSPEAIFN